MPRLILASASSVRRKLLTQAGVDFDVVAADLDEDAIKNRFRNNGASVDEAALALAEEKARTIGARHPEALVIGADQVLDLDGKWFDKPQDRAGAADHLHAFSGKSHHLVTAAVVVARGSVAWRRVERARLRVRDLDSAFIESYLDAIGDDALASVGAYQLEGRGAQLFETVEGDFFTILGLPLLPLLAFLRQRGHLDA